MTDTDQDRIATNNRDFTLSAIPKDVDGSTWPSLKLLKLRMVNFGRYEDTTLDFEDGGVFRPLTCLVGPNGTGKTTILNAIQLLLTRFQGMDQPRYAALMGKHVRNYQNMQGNDFANADFLVKGDFMLGELRYSVELTRQVPPYEPYCSPPSEHPPHAMRFLQHYHHFARFDQELHQFQLKRGMWEKFSGLFSAITGFDVKEDRAIINMGEHDIKMRKVYEENICSFIVDKTPIGREIITTRQCSAGERKITKCFSTILNKPVIPSIILIDNVTDHVEIGRHLNVIRGLQSCFDNSQLIVTCHSQPVQRNYPDRGAVVDMRMVGATPAVQSEPWRLRLSDELTDAAEKIEGCQPSDEAFPRHLRQLAYEALSGASLDKTSLINEASRSLSDAALVVGQTLAVETTPRLYGV